MRNFSTCTVSRFLAVVRTTTVRTRDCWRKAPSVSEERHHDLQSKLPNADMQGAPAALLRAAQRAREIARQTNTAIVIVRDGVLVEERVELDDSPSDATASSSSTNAKKRRSDAPSLDCSTKSSCRNTRQDEALMHKGIIILVLQSWSSTSARSCARRGHRHRRSPFDPAPFGPLADCGVEVRSGRGSNERSNAGPSISSPTVAWPIPASSRARRSAVNKRSRRL